MSVTWGVKPFHERMLAQSIPRRRWDFIVIGFKTTPLLALAALAVLFGVTEALGYDTWAWFRDLLGHMARNLRVAMTDAGFHDTAIYWIWGACGVLGILLFIMVQVPLWVYVERRLVARAQVRIGPNRTGPEGILQTTADALKLLAKESIVPRNTDTLIYNLAVILAVAPGLLIWAVFPFAPLPRVTDGVPFGGGGTLANLDVGLLWIVAVGGIGILAVFAAGFSSANRYALLGGMRAAAAFVSYEVPAVLAVVSIAIAAGTLSMQGVVEAQEIPYLLLFPLSAIIVFVSSLIEINRPPADVAEAESELIAGYHTEYGGARWAMFQLAEYVHVFAVCGIIATLFLSGWKGPGLPPFIWFFLKMWAVFGLIMLVRFTVPRFRIDQLMGFAWKYLLPLSLINILIVAVEVVLAPDLPAWLIGINLPLAGAAVVLWARVFRLLEGPPKRSHRRAIPGVTVPAVAGGALGAVATDRKG